MVFEEVMLRDCCRVGDGEEFRIIGSGRVVTSSVWLGRKFPMIPKGPPICERYSKP